MSTRSAALAVSAAALALLAPAAAWADPSVLPSQVIYNYGENEEARSAALGGAARAIGNATSALFLNPADMVETRVYHIQAIAQVTPETGRQVYGGAIVDSVTGRLAGGVSVLGGFMDKDGLNRSSLDVRIGLAYPVSDKLFFGVTGRYAKVTQAGYGPFGHDPISGGLVDPAGGRFAFVNAITFDAGLTIKATDNLYVSAVGSNLTYPNNSLVPTFVGGGIGYASGDFSLEADGLADLTSYTKTTGRFMAGGELLAGDHFPIRAGYRFDQGAKMHWASAGLGYIANEFSVEASVRRTLGSPGATMMVFSIAYFLESSGLTRSPAGPTSVVAE